LLSRDQSRYFRYLNCTCLCASEAVAANDRGKGDLGFEAFSFGSIRINGTTYEYDVVIDRGHVSKRNKKPSKKFRSAYGHTPLSIEEEIPWKRYGAYWRHVIEQAVLGAKKGGAALDANLVLVADNEQRHRVVATTVTTFFNNDCEVSLYLIEALQPSRPHFASPSFAIRIKVDQLAILQDGEIPPDADLSGEGGGRRYSVNRYPPKVANGGTL
jgi:hypothetical protein